MIAEATEHYSVRLPVPDRITDEQLRSLTMPVYAVFGSNSFMHDSEAAVAAARRNIRQVQAEYWPNATHSLPMEQPDRLNKQMLEFTDRVDRSRRETPCS
jgi:pimeloyl-ACP methyl ester carboxylesterase